jgi:hypothetical protein
VVETTLMGRRGWSTLVLLVLALALGGYILFVERHREVPVEGAEDTTRLFEGVETGEITSLVVKASNGETTSLVREGDRWTITAPLTTPADQNAASSLASAVASLERLRTIDEQPKDLGAFGLADPRVVVGFSTSTKRSARLLVGNKTPTGGDLYARLDESQAVFLIQATLETSLDRRTFDLRDKALAAFDQGAVTAVQIESGAAVTRVEKRGETWRLTQPIVVRADAGVVESLLSRLASGQMLAVASENAADLARFNLAPPAHRLVVETGKGRAALDIGAPTADGAVHGHDPSRPVVFTLDPTLVSDLVREPASLRTRDLFEFRSYVGQRFAIERDGTTRRFERRKSGETERWQQVEPAAEVTESLIVDLLTRMSTLRAEGFVDAVPATATAVATVTAVSNRGEERVVFHRDADAVYAVRADEPGAARVALAAFEEALKALDAVK